MTLTLHLGAALLCWATGCAPVLVGSTTPLGSFPAVLVETPYGPGLAFAQDARGEVFALHPVFNQRRRSLLAAPVEARRRVTAGCVNFHPNVWPQIRGATALEIVP